MGQLVPVIQIINIVRSVAFRYHIKLADQFVVCFSNYKDHSDLLNCFSNVDTLLHKKQQHIFVDAFL